jgi:CBS-domain-containing membrane protein
MNAADVMTTCVISVFADTSVREVARILHGNRISAVPVVDASGHVVGMVSEGDLIRRGRSGADGGGSWWLASFADVQPARPDAGPTPGLAAGDVMTREVHRVREDTPLQEIATLLEHHRIKRVPVEHDGKLVGLVSRANLIHGLATSRAAPASPSDAAIRGAILEVLGQAGVSTHLLNVVVSGGTVYLWGAVESRSENEAVRAAAETTPGVRKVSDHLFVLTERIRGGSPAE